eukprot:CAMPEP_0198724586 /NCGR_PEP_ID=MMETSP1475-20131203/2050_1 /TAXON_ID= ORGANISM="Unidentified sp., Strain CCMP1999" /NCGR_SAMPLE_ID=MMETSP1475 /ASSEMBLY_ACC=CAM_ASM_001111 /LENGTH=120 /DNA_ID=CAMNT_0044486159 /DNA_START=226 /DNA_END=588 /DNA_ORIENTATION=+
MSSRKRADYDDGEEEVTEVVEEEEEEEESEDGREVSQKKRSKKSLMQENEAGEMYGDIGRGKRVTVRAFNGRVGVDIREYYEKGGKQLPGKKGIWLTKDNFLTLLKYLPEIEDLVSVAPH